MPTRPDADQDRVGELEARLAEALDTLEAIRRGDIDAVVVNDRGGEHHVYTLETADRPYRFLIEQMQEGALTLTTDGTILYCNRRAAELLAAPQERVIGRKLATYVADADSPRLLRMLDAARTMSVRGEIALRRPDATLPAQLSMSVLRDGDVTLLCAVITDLSEQKRQLRRAADDTQRIRREVEERERAQEALRQAQKMQAIGQLAGGIAHDFNNLLQGLSSCIQLAKRRVAAGRIDGLDRYLDPALDNIARAGTLTHRLLSFSRRQALSVERVDPARLILGVVELIRQTIGPSITLEVRLRDGCWPILCDPNQLESALLNLAINARDAMADGGGTLGIAADHAVLTAADLAGWSGASPGEHVCIGVTDTGGGMPPEVVARAFEPFFTTKPLGQGTGLGLSQVHGFVAQSRGLVRLRSAVGRGTEVQIFLPRDRAPPPARSGPPASASTDGALAARVLLVDDEDAVRAFVAEALSDLGCAVTATHDGQSCLMALHDVLRDGGGFDLLIADIGLPRGLNGRQVADAAREVLPGLPVLLITGFAGDAIDTQAPLPAAMDVLHKPFPLDLLAARTRALLAGR